MFAVKNLTFIWKGSRDCGKLNKYFNDLVIIKADIRTNLDYSVNFVLFLVKKFRNVRDLHSQRPRKNENLRVKSKVKLFTSKA